MTQSSPKFWDTWTNSSRASSITAFWTTCLSCAIFGFYPGRFVTVCCGVWRFFLLPEGPLFVRPGFSYFLNQMFLPFRWLKAFSHQASKVLLFKWSSDCSFLWSTLLTLLTCCGTSSNVKSPDTENRTTQRIRATLWTSSSKEKTMTSRTWKEWMVCVLLRFFLFVLAIGSCGCACGHPERPSVGTAAPNALRTFLLCTADSPPLHCL